MPETGPGGIRIGLQPRIEPSGGWGMVLFSLPFIAVGGFIVGAGLELWPISGTVHVPMKLFAAFGGLFLGAGLLVFTKGALGALRKRRCAALKELRPSEPWFWDHRWNERRTTDEAGWGVLKTFFGVFGLAAFCAPFNYLVFVFDPRGVPLFAKGVIGLFDLIAFCAFLHAIYVALRWLKYGSSFLVFRSFPFFLGDELRAALEGRRDFRSFEKLALTLRAVLVRMETHGTGKHRSTRAVAHKLWSESKELRSRDISARDGSLDISFRLPDDPKLASGLSAQAPRYWELIVEGDAPGVDYKASFLVPVYAKR